MEVAPPALKEFVVTCSPHLMAKALRSFFSSCMNFPTVMVKLLFPNQPFFNLSSVSHTKDTDRSDNIDTIATYTLFDDEGAIGFVLPPPELDVQAVISKPYAGVTVNG